jgi:XTP/dITP diphosphohydrolase
MIDITYITSNLDKSKEATIFFKQKMGFKLKIVNPGFPLPEIQASTCGKVAAFSASYAANKLNCPVVKSDAGFYVEALGGLPGPYSTYFDRQIGVDKFLELLKDETNRHARIELAWAYCEPGGIPKVFSDGTAGIIARQPCGKSSRWVDKFFIPDGETKTISAIRDNNYHQANQFWGDAKLKLATWLKNK